jgi:hypothetical protein
MIFADIFPSNDLSGGAKALWTVFVIVLPFLGIIVYLMARGHKMQEQVLSDAKAQDQAMREYVQNVTANGSPAEEISLLADLRNQRVISEAEFPRAKAKALA